MATAARMPMIATTIINSINVKPCWTRRMRVSRLEQSLNTPRCSNGELARALRHIAVTAPQHCLQNGDPRCAANLLVFLARLDVAALGIGLGGRRATAFLRDLLHRERAARVRDRRRIARRERFVDRLVEELLLVHVLLLARFRQRHLGRMQLGRGLLVRLGLGVLLNHGGLLSSETSYSGIEGTSRR